MLELPESRTVARQLNETVKGRVIRKVVAGFTPHGFAFFHGDPAGYPALLEGRAIDESVPIAGLVEMRMGEARLQFNDGVNLRYLAPGAKPPKKHQLYIELEDGAVLYCSVQMYGGMQAYLEGGLDDNFYHCVAREKPDPLSDEFDRNYFDALFTGAKQTLSAKAFLATEQRIPGLGNGVLQDILFSAAIHPKRKLRDMDGDARERLFHSVKDTLRAMTGAGGRDTEKDLFGQPGGYRCLLSKNTLPYPCPKCGGGILKQAYLGGAIYFCPTCQPL